MKYLNKSLTWLRLGVLVKRQLSGDRNLYKVLEIKPTIVQLERVTHLQTCDPPISWHERKWVEKDFFPVNEAGDIIDKPEIDKSVQALIQHLTNQVKDSINDAIATEYIRTASCYKLEIEQASDEDMSGISDFDKLLDNSLEPVIEYLIDTINWDKYVHDNQA